MKAAEEILNIKKQNQLNLLKKNNVTGVGIGYKISNGKLTDELSLVTLVTRKVSKQSLSSSDTIPASIQGVKTDVIEVGEIIAHQSRTVRERPAHPGMSIGHYNITAGTFGAVVRDNRTGKRMILSNNHVLANSNNASTGDPILQPGQADGGINPQDQIATLERFIRIQMEGQNDTDTGSGSPSNCNIANFFASSLNAVAKLSGSKTRLVPQKVATAEAQSESNLMDAALARPLSDDLILDEIIDIGMVREVRSPELGLEVIKSGRTTGTTTGQITTLNAFIRVSYGGDNYAAFDGQILTTPMSKPGDSGSLLVSRADNKAVGLLFAGSDQTTIHSPIQSVMEVLDFDFNI